MIKNKKDGRFKKKFTDDMVLDAIKTNPCGVTLTEIIRAVGCNEVTARKLIKILDNDGKITRRQVGMAWLYIAVQGDIHDTN